MTQDPNPYRPPTSLVGDVSAASGRLEPATRGRRFGTLIVDYFGVAFFGLVVGIVIGLTLGEEGVKAIEDVPDLAFGLPLVFLYYVFFEGIWNRTPGKWVFGTLVVDQGGGKPTLAQVLGRTACRFIPFEALSFFGATGWHDSIPKTRVVRLARGA